MSNFSGKALIRTVNRQVCPMEFEKLAGLILDGLKPRLENHTGLTSYARERSDFAGWLIVESCRVLLDANLQPELEAHKYDLAFDDWALNVRTLTTNFSYPKAPPVKRPTTRNVDMLTKDILKITNPGRSVGYPKRGILFVVFPLEHENEQWQTIHLSRITGELTRIEHRPFEFSTGVPGMMYLGLCSAQG